MAARKREQRQSSRWTDDLRRWLREQPARSERGLGEWLGRVLVLVFAVLAAGGYIPWRSAPWLVLGVVALSALLAITAARIVVVYAGIWFGFTALRGWADNLGAPLRGDEVAAIDRWLGGGTLPSRWLQDTLAGIPAVEMFDRAMIAVHLSYFITPHLAAIWLWWRAIRSGHGRPLRQYLIALAILMGMGLMLHALFPTEPPWMLASRDGQPEVQRIVWGGDASTSATVGSDGQVYGSFTDTNPVAALPSLHLGISLLMALVLLPLSRALGALPLLYTAAMGFALVYLGEHYLIDVIAGGALAVVAVWAARRLVDSSWANIIGIVPHRDSESSRSRATAGSRRGWVESGD